MALFRRLRSGLRALVRKDLVRAEHDDEVRDFYERARDDLEGRGLSPSEAARAARLGLGDEGRARETLSAFGWENTVETTLGDLRQALRRLARAPGFAFVAVLTLALGIGASTAIYSAVAPILFEPLSYPRADRLVMMSDYDIDGAPLDVTFGNYEEIVARSRSFAGLAAMDYWQPALQIGGAGDPERLDAQFVTADYFNVLGVRPSLGRDFEPADDTFGGPPVVIVSESLARRRFGGTRAILGEQLTLDGFEHTVIGVMPDDFDNVLAPTVDLWAPRQFRPHADFQTGEWGHHMRMIGRLADGVSIERASEEIMTIARSPSDEFPRPDWAALQNGLRVESLQAAVTGDVRAALLALLGAVLLLLVIACVNVTNLLLARGALRKGELAVRAALGAGRGRLTRQLFVESLLLAALGGVAGLAVAALGVKLIVALAPAGLPRVDAVGLDLPSFAFALVITVVVGAAVGFVPALRGAAADLRVDLQSQGRATRGGHARLRRALVVTEVALALVILAGTGLLLRSVDRLLSTPPGFDATNLLTMQIIATERQFDPAEESLAYFQAVLEAASNVPGVASAALTSQLPLSGDFDSYGPRFESAPLEDPNETGVFRYIVTPGWFETMRIRLVRGRLLDTRDRAGTPEAVVISETFARRYFGEDDPIGQRVRFGPENFEPDRPWGTVVGVVEDVKQSSLALTPSGAFYIPLGQWVWVDGVQSLVVRTQVDASALTADVRRAIWSVDPTPPIVRVATMDDLVAASEGQRRFVLTVLVIFAAAALALAVLGLYGVIAGSVAERRREIGLRAALGASPARLLKLVVGQGLLLTAVGAAIGLSAAFGATRALETLLYGVTPLDPLTYAVAVALLAAAALAASALPAWQAARVDPTIPLRSE